MSQHHKTTRSSQAALERYREECKEAGLACWICHQEIDYAADPRDFKNPDRFQRDHIDPVSKNAELAEDPSNWAPSHAGCNRDRSNSSPRRPLGEPSQAWT